MAYEVLEALEGGMGSTGEGVDGFDGAIKVFEARRDVAQRERVQGRGGLPAHGDDPVPGRVHRRGRVRRVLRAGRHLGAHRDPRRTRAERVRAGSFYKSLNIFFF